MVRKHRLEYCGEPFAFRVCALVWVFKRGIIHIVCPPLVGKCSFGR